LALYLGLLRIPLKHLFNVTNAMLALLAAGLSSSAAGFLVQSNLLPTAGAQVWDTSRVLSDASPVGRVLGILIGYKATPAGIQIVFYVATLCLLALGVGWQRRRSATNPRLKNGSPEEPIAKLPP
jgi:high-affinity iron transporter